MERKFLMSATTLVVWLILLAPFVHGLLMDMTLFHGYILHPVFFLSGVALYAFLRERRKRG